MARLDPDLLRAKATATAGELTHATTAPCEHHGTRPCAACLAARVVGVLCDERDRRPVRFPREAER